jgi:hypothetical protein
MSILLISLLCILVDRFVNTKHHSASRNLMFIDEIVAYSFEASRGVHGARGAKRTDSKHSVSILK